MLADAQLIRRRQLININTESMKYICLMVDILTAEWNGDKMRILTLLVNDGSFIEGSLNRLLTVPLLTVQHLLALWRWIY